VLFGQVRLPPEAAFLILRIGKALKRKGFYNIESELHVISNLPITVIIPMNHQSGPLI
jgi:hypothetical protein